MTNPIAAAERVLNEVGITRVDDLLLLDLIAWEQGGLALCVSEDIDDWQSQHADVSREQEANRFAAALLLPERFFKPLCRKQEPSLDLLAELADAFDVSLTATALQYLRFCNEACAVVLSRDGIIKWFRGSRYFDELGVFIPVARRLDPSSLAASFFQGDTLPATRTTCCSCSRRSGRSRRCR